MTDHEKKQREILERYFSIERSQIYWQLSALERQKEKARSNKRIDQALAELSKLDAIPTSKEVEYCECYPNMTPGQAIPVDKVNPPICKKCKKEISLVKPKEEVGVEEIAEVIGELCNWDFPILAEQAANSLLTKYSITRKG